MSNSNSHKAGIIPLMAKTDKQYVSEIDKLLTKFDKSCPLSPSQQAEIKKHERVYHLRDHPELLRKDESDLWD